MEIDFKLYGLKSKKVQKENSFATIIGSIYGYSKWDNEFCNEKLKEDDFSKMKIKKRSMPSSGDSYFIELMELKKSIISEGLKIRNKNLDACSLRAFIDKKVKEFGTVDLKRLKKIPLDQAYILHFGNSGQGNNVNIPLWLFPFFPSDINGVDKSKICTDHRFGFIFHTIELGGEK